jgi:hypothetical protein
MTGWEFRKQKAARSPADTLEERHRVLVPLGVPEVCPRAGAHLPSGQAIERTLASVLR